MGDCYAPSNLMSKVYDAIEDPLILGGSDEGETIFDSEASISNDFTLRALYWGGAIIVLTLLVMIVSIVWHCFTCICCCCTKEQRAKKKSSVARWECTVWNIIVALLCMGMLGGAFWADIKMNSSLLKHEDEVELFLDAVSTGDTETDILDIFYHIEDIRHGLVIAFLTVVIVLQPLMILTACISPLCKLSTPVAVIVMLIVFAIITLLTAVMFGFTFSYLILLGDVCMGFYTLAGKDQCSSQSMPYSDELEVFCNDSFQYAFILLVLGCGVIVTLLVLQCSGSTFAGLLTGDIRRERRKSNSPPPTNPDHEISAWDTYGTNQVLGVTPNGYQSGVYPMYVQEMQPQQFSATAPPSYAEVMEGADSGAPQREIEGQHLHEVNLEEEREMREDVEEEEGEEGEEQEEEVVIRGDLNRDEDAGHRQQQQEETLDTA